MRILVVEDDASLARGLVAALRGMGFAVDHEPDGRDAVRIATSEPYSLMILDLNLPCVSGLDILQELRRRGCRIPVMILTVRQAISERVKGLDLGADDYLAKPFDLAELEARVRALIRRAEGAPMPLLTCGALSWARTTGELRLNGDRLALRRREAAVLVALLVRTGQVITKDRLLAEVFGFDEPVGPNALELYVARLRRRLEPGGPCIRTIRGVGYMLEAR